MGLMKKLSSSFGKKNVYEKVRPTINAIVMVMAARLAELHLTMADHLNLGMLYGEWSVWALFQKVEDCEGIISNTMSCEFTGWLSPKAREQVGKFDSLA